MGGLYSRHCRASSQLKAAICQAWIYFQEWAAVVCMPWSSLQHPDHRLGHALQIGSGLLRRGFQEMLSLMSFHRTPFPWYGGSLR